MGKTFTYINQKNDIISLEYIHLRTFKEDKKMRLDDCCSGINWVKFEDIKYYYHQFTYHDKTEEYIETQESELISKIIEEYWQK